MKNIASLILFLLPASRVKCRLISCIPGYAVDVTARLSPCVVHQVATIRIGRHARIALGSTFQNLAILHLGEGATIGRSNWVSSSPSLAAHSSSRSAGMFSLGRQSAVTSRHHIDCTGGFTVGDFTTVAGHGSTVLTHSIDVMTSRQTTRPVRIGDYCFIGSNCTLTAGTEIADRIVVGAGSVTLHKLSEQETLYAGVPATPRKKLSGASYFSRKSGRVLPTG